MVRYSMVYYKKMHGAGAWHRSLSLERPAPRVSGDITTGIYTPFRKSMSTVRNKFPGSGNNKKGVFSFF
jgi:hypothetical protein